MKLLVCYKGWGQRTTVAVCLLLGPSWWPGMTFPDTLFRDTTSWSWETESDLCGMYSKTKKIRALNSLFSNYLVHKNVERRKEALSGRFTLISLINKRTPWTTGVAKWGENVEVVWEQTVTCFKEKSFPLRDEPRSQRLKSAEYQANDS